MRKYSIPCEHTKGLALETETVNAYHPLSKDEIAVLLQIAQGLDDVSAISDIQVRLGQGIRGLVCPHEIDGPVAEALNELDSLFVENFRKGADPSLVDEFYEIMQVK